MWRRYTPGCFSTRSSLLSAITRLLPCPHSWSDCTGGKAPEGWNPFCQQLQGQCDRSGDPQPSRAAARNDGRGCSYSCAGGRRREGRARSRVRCCRFARWWSCWYGGAASSCCRARRCCPRAVASDTSYQLGSDCRTLDRRQGSRVGWAGFLRAALAAHKRRRGWVAAPRCKRHSMTSRHCVRGLVTSACPLTAAPPDRCVGRVRRLWLALRSFSAAIAQPRVELRPAGDQR